jgi:glucosamine-6-phosphate deaminase
MSSWGAREHIPTVVVEDSRDLAIRVARRIADVIRDRQRAGRPAVLGLATGSTPVDVYAELVRLHRDEGLSFRGVTTFNLDEYYPMDPLSIHSYARYMREHLFDHVDIDRANVHIPRGDIPRTELVDACRRYEAAIREAGGIDLQLLGIGKTGHIGFNEPGSGVESRTRTVTLDPVTRLDAAADFFGEEHVPREAVTMGVGTILEAREILILATGEHKAPIVRRAVEGPVDVEVAATFLQRHPATTFYLDGAAAAELTRIATPWVVGDVAWDESLALRGVVWLARETGVPILKLTRRDYAEGGLSSLVAWAGSAGALNGRVFNALGAKIRGKSKLPQGLRVIVFSPHPDDDVISMGGILRKLVENGNAVTVAYMTSGNIAVFDHDVRRHLDFLTRLARERHLAEAAVSTFVARVESALAAKSPGDIDIPEVQEVKRLIRESEAVGAVQVLGLPATAAKFLNLPFYQTGTVLKAPIGGADIAPVRALLDACRPQIVFVAGDLSDPHGTHRLCKEIVDRALESYVMNNQAPEVWLYRGAWQEWSPSEATWLVPMSQDEMRLKIQAIFKHQSQKDSAPFPGGDEREFWQRVEARNTGLAAELDRLGLAAYFAMEAYVVQRPGTGDQ